MTEISRVTSKQTLSYAGLFPFVSVIVFMYEALGCCAYIRRTLGVFWYLGLQKAAHQK